MTEEQGGEQIGRLTVEIDGNLSPLEAILAEGLKKLEAFIAKEYTAKIGVQFENTGGASSRPQGLIDRHGKQLGVAIGQAALGQIEASVGKASVKDVKVEAKTKVDKDTLVAAIQGALNGHKFKLDLDVGHLQAQVQQSLGNIQFTASAAAGHAAPLAPTKQGLTETQKAEFDARFAAHKLGNVGDASANLGKLVQFWDQSLRNVVGGTPGKSATDAFLDMVDLMGDKLDDWGQKLEELAPDELLGPQFAKNFHSNGALYQDILAARGGQRSEPAPVPNGAFIAQVAKTLAQQQAKAPVTEKEPSYNYGEATFGRAKRFAAGIQSPTSLEDIIKGAVGGNRVASPSVTATLLAALNAPRLSVDAAGDRQDRRQRNTSSGSKRGGVRSGTRDASGLFVSTPNGEGPRGVDLEADARADAQLGTNRANIRRGRASGDVTVEGFAVKLEGLLRTLERGGLRNIAREDNGNLHEFNPRDVDSAQGFSEFRRRVGNRAFSLPEVEKPLRFIKPQDVVRQIVEQAFGGDLAEKILSDPKIERTIGQAISQGATNKPFNFLGAESGATRLGGQSVEASARQGLRLQQLLKETDQTMAEVETRLESLAGSGKPTDRLEGTLNRLGLRRQRLATELEAVTPNTDRNLSAQDRKILAAGSSRSRAENRERIELGTGLNPLERALKEETSEKTIARNIAEKMRDGLLPAYDTLVSTISDALANAQPLEQGGRDPFAAGRDAAVRGAQASLAQQFGLTDEEGNKVRGRSEDQKYFDATFKEALNEVRAVSYQQRAEGDRAVNLAEAGAGKGRRPKTQIGSHVDPALVSVGGAAVVKPDYARPTTSLDTEEATLRKPYEDAARAIAQRQLDQLNAERQKGFRDPNTGRFRSAKDIDYDKVGIEDLLYAPRIRKAGGGTTPKEIKPEIQAEVEGTTDVGKRMAEIRLTRAVADEVLKHAGPARPLPSGRKRGVSEDRIARIKELGLTPAVEKEAIEVLQQNARGQRTPYTKAGKEVPTGDQNRERYAAAAEGRERQQILAGGGGPGGAGGSGRGGAFGGFPIPLPVLVVNDILRVAIEGGGAGRAASAASKAEDEAEPTTAPTSTPISGSSRLPKRLRYKRSTFEDPYSKLGSGKLQFVDKGIGVATTPITYLNSAEVSRDRQRVREERRPEIEERALLARQRRLRSQARVQDPVGYAAEQDTEDFEGKELRAQLRVLGRRIPRRSFGASLTDLLSSIVPGHGSLEKQLEFGDLATREASEIQRARTQRAQTRTTINTLGGQIQEARATGQPQRAEQLTQVLREQQVAYKNQTAVIAESTKRFKTFYAEATKASTVLRSFGAAAIGGAAAGGLGSLQFAAGAIIAQPIMQAFSALIDGVLAPAIDRASGYQATAAREQTALGQATRAAGGRAELAFAQTELQTGLGPQAASQIRQPLTQRAQIEAGNSALREQLDLFRAAQKIREQGGPEAALSQNLTGVLGLSIGGQPSAEETINDLFQGVSSGGASPAAREGRDRAHVDIEGQIATLNQQREEAQAAGVDTGILDDQIQKFRDQLKYIDDTFDTLGKGIDQGGAALDFFNAQAKDAGANIKAVFSENISDADRTKQVAALREAGLNRFASDVSQGRLAFTDQSGRAITNSQEFQDQILKYASNAPKASPEAFLEAQAPQIKAQQYLTRRQQQFNLSQIPIQEGLANSQQPFLPANAGFTAKDAAGFKTELGGAQKIFDQLAKEAAQARSDAVSFFETTFPGDAAGATEFADALQKSAQYGQQISKIQLGVQTAQAAFEAKQYSVQIKVVQRSLADALGLQGKITDSSKNLGAIEREQFQLQRESQALSLGQSQRQINFQRAIAGLAAPGLTGEERAARIEQAKLEADYAQKQLDIQKKLFGLGGKQFTITADRNVQDLTNQLGLLQQGREVTLRTAVAAKQVQALTALQARENKRISAFYQSAVEATGQVMQLEAQLVANTEIGLNKVGNLVLEQFRKVYTGLIRDLGGAPPASSGNPNPHPIPTASGGLFQTKGMTHLTGQRTVGEAGDETVAILRNPRPSNFGTAESTSVVIDLRGSTISDEDLLRKVTAAVQQAVERGDFQEGQPAGTEVGR
jgi:hypothetical protein